MQSRVTRALVGPAAALALLAVASLLAPAAAQTAAHPLFAFVERGDADLGDATQARNAPVSFFDADGNGKLGAAAPAEPVYLDLDDSRSVTYGDLRLTGIGPYTAGTLVDVPDQDIGRALNTVLGQFTTKGASQWVIDNDADGKLTPGDLLLGTTVVRIVPGDAGAGQGLDEVPAQSLPRGVVNWIDANHDGRIQPGESVYVDADATGAAGAGRVSPGDLRITPTGFAVQAPAPVASVPATPGSTAQSGDGLGATPSGALATGSGSQAAAERTGLLSNASPVEIILLVLVLVNVIGLVVVARRVAAQKPKNPFK